MQVSLLLPLPQGVKTAARSCLSSAVLAGESLQGLSSTGPWQACRPAACRPTAWQSVCGSVSVRMCVSLVWAWGSVCVCEKLYVCELVCTPMCKCKVCMRNLRVCSGVHPCVSVYVCMRNECMWDCVHVCSCVYLCMCYLHTYVLAPWLPFAFPKQLSHEQALKQGSSVGSCLKSTLQKWGQDDSHWPTWAAWILRLRKACFSSAPHPCHSLRRSWWRPHVCLGHVELSVLPGSKAQARLDVAAGHCWAVSHPP